MTSDELTKPRQAGVTVADGGDAHATGFRPGPDGPTTYVRVIPLWDRPRTGVRG